MILQSGSKEGRWGDKPEWLLDVSPHRDNSSQRRIPDWRSRWMLLSREETCHFWTSSFAMMVTLTHKCTHKDSLTHSHIRYHTRYEKMVNMCNSCIKMHLKLNIKWSSFGMDEWNHMLETESKDWHTQKSLFNLFPLLSLQRTWMRVKLAVEPSHLSLADYWPAGLRLYLISFDQEKLKAYLLL